MANHISPLINGTDSKMFLVAVETVTKDGKIFHGKIFDEAVNKSHHNEVSQALGASQEYVVGEDREKLNIYIDQDSKGEIPRSSVNYRQPCEDAKSLFKCLYCHQTTFANRSNLLRHIRSAHSNERPFCCNECGASFAQNSNLVKHQLIHTGHRPYSCNFCGRRFTQRANLKKHLFIHTGERPYKCSFCAKSFAQQTNLDKHVRTHTGSKPYVCKICAKGFTQQNNLVKHMYTHDAKKPFSCQNCNKSYTQKLNLEKHVKNCIKITIVM